MTPNLRRIFAVLSVIVFSGLLIISPRQAHALNESFNIVTSPLPINLGAKPGTTVTTDIKIKNGGAETEKLKVSLMKFAAYGEEGKPSIKEREAGDDYFDWVKFSPELFNAPSNEWITIKMTINLPKTAAFGYYYAVVISRADKPVAATARQNLLVGSTAVLVLLDAQAKGANRTATVTSFAADKKFYEFLPSKFSIKIKNSGNVHLIPTGNIFITRGSKTVATLDVNTAAGNVLPKSNRIFITDWTDSFPVYTLKEENGKVVIGKDGKQTTSLKWDFTKASHLKIGRYTAHLVLAYDNGTSDVPLEATVSFWVIPLRIIGTALLILLLAGFGLWSFIRKVYKKIPKKKAKSTDEKPL